jgi:hypothetical protein
MAYLPLPYASFFRFSCVIAFLRRIKFRWHSGMSRTSHWSTSASLHAKGLLHGPKGCRVPNDRRFPRLGLDEVVSFAAFHELWLALPAHNFLRDLLYFFQIELHHLGPGGILNIVMVIMSCEVFLGIEVHFCLWKYFFHACVRMKPLPMAGGVVLLI